MKREVLFGCFGRHQNLWRQKKTRTFGSEQSTPIAALFVGVVFCTERSFLTFVCMLSCVSFDDSFLLNKDFVNFDGIYK